MSVGHSTRHTTRNDDFIRMYSYTSTTSQKVEATSEFSTNKIFKPITFVSNVQRALAFPSDAVRFLNVHVQLHQTVQKYDVQISQ